MKIFLLLISVLLFCSSVNKSIQVDDPDVNLMELSGLWILPSKATYTINENYRHLDFYADNRTVAVVPSGDTVFFYKYQIRGDTLVFYNCNKHEFRESKLFVNDCDTIMGQCRILALSKDSLVVSSMLKDNRKLTYYRKFRKYWLKDDGLDD